ncbi:MAG: hypothetical protein PF693_16725 [Spirochaetia bacterium]|jgi:hypothetical protein|nr:hypothetical protein [Spirochaetia bacterium]
MSKQKYSEWLRVDLHIHTDKSKKTKNNDYKGSFSVDKLKEKLNENDVAVISLTDHNIMNVDAYEEYYNSYDENNDPLLLPGVELDLEVVHNGETKRYHTLLVFRESTAEKVNEISTKLEEQYALLGITNMFLRKLNIDQVVSLFYNDDFFFIPHANRHKTGMVKAYDGHIEDAQEMILLMPSALEKVKEEVIHIYNEGFNKHLNNDFKDRDDIAYITFSDNHFIEGYPCKHMGDQGEHNFYYLKGSKNYETLRLAFIDPKSRIISSQGYNSINHSLNSIEEIKIKNDAFIEDISISFSPHLNVIIGGRSSGKSLLHNILGQKVDRIKTENTYEKKVNLENITIKSSLDSTFLETTSLSSELIYINQGDIVRYFEEKKLFELAEESNKQEEYTESKSKFKKHKRYFEEKIEALTDTYQNAFSSISEKKYKLHSATMAHYLDENYIFRFDESKLLETFDIVSKLSESSTLISELSENLKNFRKNQLFSFTTDEITTINNFNTLLQSKTQLISNTETFTKKRLKFIRNIQSIIDEKNKSLNIEARAKGEAGTALIQLSKDFGCHFRKMSMLKQKCDDLINFKYSLQEKITLNEDVELVLEVAESEEIGKLIIEGLSTKTKGDSLYLNLINLITDSSSKIKNYSDNKDGETLNKKINKLLSDLYQKIDSPIDYLKYSDGSSSKDNSPGYNSEKYLEIILKNPKNKFIFIDQPEDNLGNKFIADKLVRLIRDLKFKKQIFLVTHNPSIVVYGDAENIIIARNNKNKISYKQIVLEDQNAQTEICSILDGGEYIFNDRSKKYNIKRILKGDRENA